MTSQTCLDETIATQLLLGTLPHDEAEAREQHLLDCAACLDRAQSITASDWLIESLRNGGEKRAPLAEGSVVSTLVSELEQLGGAAQIAASAHEEIRTILGQPHANDELGRLLHFRVLDVLGAGGMGIVFKAEDCQLNRIVALKVMRPSLAADPEAKLRFRREAKAVAAFEHDHIITVYQVEEDNGIPVFSMQLLEGESLRTRLRREGKLAPEEALRVTREITAGLIEAHGRGLLHRDIKPDNIWLQSPDGRVKILDFGLVRSIEERSSLTHSGAILGTPEYMAPEQACGEAVDERCDLFSLGCVLFHMLTGEPPFKAKNVVATLVAVSNANVTSPRLLNEGVPKAVADLTLNLLEREPDNRVSSAEELATKIEHLEQQPSLQTATQHSGSNKAMLWLWLASGAAAILAGIIAIQTHYGTLNIEADKNVVAIVQGDSVQLVDKTTDRKYDVSVGENKLRPGDYEIVTREEATGLEFTAKEFTIRRGGEKAIQVSLSPPKPKAEQAAAAPPEPSIPANAQKPETNKPTWTTGVADSLAIKRGQAISSLALVQKPDLADHESAISWTYETQTHRGSVTDARYSPDGQYLATSGNDGTVRIWKDQQQVQVIVCPGAEKHVTAVAWSGDGKLLAAASDKSITIWNVESIADGPKFINQMNRRARELAWNQDVLSFSDNDGVHFWHGGELLPNSGMTGQISAQPCSRDGKFFACRQKDVIKVWDTSSEKIAVHATIGSEGFARSNSLLKTTVDAPVFDAEFGYFAFPVNHYPVDRQRGPDGYSELLIYDASNAARMKSLRLKERPREYAWNPGGNGFTYLGREKIHSINLETDETTTTPLPEPILRRSAYERCVWSQRKGHNELLITSMGRVWQQRNNEPPTQLKWLTSHTSELLTSSTENRIAVRSFSDGKLDSIRRLPSTLEVWDRKTRKTILTLNSVDVTEFALSPEGKTLGHLTTRNSVESIDIDSGEKLFETNLDSNCHGIHFSPTGDRLCVATEKGRKILNSTTGEILHTIDSGYTIRWEGWWAPDGKRYVRKATSQEFRGAFPSGGRASGGGRGGRGGIAAAFNGGLFVVGEDFKVERKLEFREASANQIHESVHNELRDHETQREEHESAIDNLMGKIGLARNLEDEAPDTASSNEMPNLTDAQRKLSDKVIELEFEIVELRSLAQAIDLTVKQEKAFEESSRPRQTMPGSLIYESRFRQLPEAKKLYLARQRIRCLRSQMEAALRGGADSKQYTELKDADQTVLAKINKLRNQNLRKLMRESSRVDLEAIQRERNAALEELQQKEATVRDLQAEFADSLKAANPDERKVRIDLLELASKVVSVQGVSNRQKRLESAQRAFQMTSRTRPMRVGVAAWSPDGRYVLSTSEDTNRRLHLYVWDLNKESNAPTWKVPIKRDSDSSRYDDTIHFSPDSKQAALVIENNVVFTNVETGETNLRPIGDDFDGVGWLADDTFLIESRDELQALSIADERTREFRRPYRMELLNGKLLSTQANTVQIRGKDLQLESSLLFEQVQGESVLTEVRSDGWTSNSELPRVELDAQYRFKTIGHK